MAFSKGDAICRGRYCLKNLLGEGTYGSVWLAQDTRLEIPVAIKALHATHGRIGDLRAEAVTQARLSHDNIVRIYDVDVDDRVIVMEYIEGASLESHLKDLIRQEGWIQASRSKDILAQCFDALIYAHSKQVVHGDVKPANIMIQEDLTAKLTDFGVAKVIAEQYMGTYPSGLPRRMGSTTYSAPEVIRGEPRDFQSDMFSLGIVA